MEKKAHKIIIRSIVVACIAALVATILVPLVLFIFAISHYSPR